VRNAAPFLAVYFMGEMFCRIHHYGLLFSMLLIATESTLLSKESTPLPAFHAELDKAWSSTFHPVLQEAIKRGDLPGAVLCVGRQGSNPWMRAVGNRQVSPQVVANKADTIYDLASLTKPVVTATLIMKLYEAGKLDIDHPVAKYLPDFAVQGKEHITLRQLLLHTSGLIADNALTDYQAGQEEAIDKLLALKPIRPADECFVYSDVGFLTLGQVIEQVTGTPLDHAARELLFEPLGMKHTMFNPSKELIKFVAPQNKRNDSWLLGTVHDPRAAALGGVAGHAGVFSTVSDLAHYAEMILNEGKYAGQEILKPRTVRLMLTPHTVPLVKEKSGKTQTASRTLGWDHQSPYSSNRGTKLSDRAIGHGGFTGTTMWIDPDKQLYIIFLSNRLHPDGQGNVNMLVGKLTDEIVTALESKEKSAE
jgi:serine-type D-Ala-D-Ala carboxypeptidase